MNVIPVSKSPSQNRLEGFFLTVLFQGLPTYTIAVLMVKLAGMHEIVGERWGALIFVILASILHGIVTPWLAPKFPKFCQQGYEPLFFEPGLSFSEKIAQWRVQPLASVQLVTTMLILCTLAVGVVSLR